MPTSRPDTARQHSRNSRSSKRSTNSTSPTRPVRSAEAIDGLFEESEEVDVVERRYVIKKHKKRKYRCSCHNHIETAFGPPELIDGGRYSARSNQGVMFRFDESRDSHAAGRLLERFSGTVVCDGHGAYEKLKNDRAQQRLDEPRAGPIELAGCMAHARRKFIRAENYDSRAGKILDEMATLYAIESKLHRKDDETLEEFFDRRRSVRQQEAKPILEVLDKWFHSTNVLPKSPMGKALTYAQNHWKRLTKYADDGRLPIDNNGVERALRQPVVGRKNYYGCRTTAGLRVAEVLYTLIGTCRILGVSAHDYLKEAALRAVRFSAVDPLTPHDLVDEAA